MRQSVRRYVVSMIKYVLSALVLALCAISVVQRAQAQTPSYAEQAGDGDQQIRGRIVSFDGGYNLGVRDENGNVDRVESA